MSDLESVFTELVAEDAAASGDTTDAVESDNLDSGITVDESQTESTESETDTGDTPPVETPSADSFDWEAVADQLIPVKVNGEERMVPLREARDGFMMREDYSRKTAELAEDRKFAEWAKDVQYSFANDPEGTLKAFARAYGVDAALQVAQATQVPEADPYEDMDPDMAAIARQFDAKFQALQEQHANELQAIRQQTGQIAHERLVQQAQAEMAGLKSQFERAGMEFSELEVLQVATENEIPLTQAAALWAGSKTLQNGLTASQAQAAAQQAATARAAEADQQRQVAKQRASTTAKTKYEASGEPDVPFQTLTDLFEIELAKGQ